jgi:uncharacterized oxidoreductase
MPIFRAEQLQSIASSVLQGASVPAAHADVVAHELAEANLVGHDSHGVIRLMQYVDYVEKGFIKPQGRFDVVKEGPSFLIVDGQFQFGQVTTSEALARTMDKARAVGTATTVIRNCNHVGRLGSYTHQAALAGFGAMMVVNAPGPGGVAPYGGIEQKLGTNPISWSVPRGDAPLVLDMTSSATAEGKLRVAFQKGENVPEGWVIDAAGNPSTDPAVFYADPPGAILPLGGAMGFKGYGLSVMIDMFGGVLSGSGICRTDLPRGANGVWMYLVDIRQFVEPEEYDRLLDCYADSMKNSRKAPGVSEILLPGEIEQRRRVERQNAGISVADETWRQIQALAGKLGVKLDIA